MLEVSMGLDLVLSFLKIRCRPIRKPEKALGSYRKISEYSLPAGLFSVCSVCGKLIEVFCFLKNKSFQIEKMIKKSIFEAVSCDHG